MGSTVSVYNNTRTPDGPLLKASVFNTTELSYRHLNKWGLNYTVFGFTEDLLADKGPKTPYAVPKATRPKVETPVRQSRRRPTYSAKNLKVVSDNEDDDGTNSHSSSEYEETNAKSIKCEKILNYRKTLTRIVKIKCNIFHEKVKVTCSKDGKCLEWYKVKSSREQEQEAEETHQKKNTPIGTLALDKITGFKTKVDNLRCLEISDATNTYIFTFKTRDEREEWQTEFDSLVKFVKLM